MSKEIIDGKRVNVKSKTRNPVIQFDKLKMYFAEPYVIDLEDCEGKIEINQPTIGDIISIGEDIFYSSLNPIITNTTTYKSMLWDMNVDWTEMSDFELFVILYKNISTEVSQLLMGIDLANFQLTKKQTENNEQIILYDFENNIEINEQVYYHMSQYLRTCCQIFPKEIITKDNMLKRLYIQKDKNAAARKNEDDSSSIQSIISACVNHPGFKYKLSELKQVHVYEFYDSVKRLQIYENSTALMKGMYSGMIDGSKINPKDYDFMRSI